PGRSAVFFVPAEPERSRAEAANRTRGRFEHEHAFVVDATFRMDRTVPETDGARGLCHRPDDGLLHPLRRARWCDVQRLLKEWTVERIGFVEHRQQVSLAAVDERLDGILAAGNEALDQRVLVQLVTFHPDVRRLKQSPQAIARAGER